MSPKIKAESDFGSNNNKTKTININSKKKKFLLLENKESKN